MNKAVHVVARTSVAAGITGAVVALAATPALAGAGSLTVSPSGTLTSNAVITATATDNNNTGAMTDTVQLSVTRPDSSTAVLASGTTQPLSSKTLKATVDTSSLNINGSYLFSFAVNGTKTSKTVTMQVPPADVAGFAGTPSGTVAHFSWASNTEPDLAGYDLVDVTDSQPRDLTPGGLGTNVCSNGSCAVDIDFGSSAAGTTRNFVAYALRYSSPAHTATIASVHPSQTATVSFPAPPAPAPAASGGTTTGSTSAGGSTTGTGSTSSGTTGGTSSRTGGETRTPTISSKHASAALRAYLPSASAGAAPNLPAVVTEIKPLPQGTYKPTLAYPDLTVRQPVHKQDSAPMAAVGSDIVRVLNITALWRSLAAAAVVLLVAAHLRAWLRRLELAEG